MPWGSVLPPICPIIVGLCSPGRLGGMQRYPQGRRAVKVLSPRHTVSLWCGTATETGDAMDRSDRLPGPLRQAMDSPCGVGHDWLLPLHFARSSSERARNPLRQQFVQRMLHHGEFSRGPIFLYTPPDCFKVQSKQHVAAGQPVLAPFFGPPSRTYFLYVFPPGAHRYWREQMHN